MRIRFMGGAGEVGASAMLVVSNSGKNILLDAGVRVNEEGTEMLPNLEPLNSVSLDAIIVSHAHLDHSGRCLWSRRYRRVQASTRRLLPKTWLKCCYMTRLRLPNSGRAAAL